MEQRKKIAFKDGVCFLFSPLNKECAKAHFNFAEYKVGINRFYSALLAGVEVARVIQIPKSPISIDGTETVVIEGEKYFIKQIQAQTKTIPQTLVLTLSRTG